MDIRHKGCLTSGREPHQLARAARAHCRAHEAQSAALALWGQS